MKNTLILLVTLFMVKFALAQPDLIFKSGFSFVIQLNDTGITWGGDYDSGNNFICTSNIGHSQDCHQGRDVTYYNNSNGHAGFDFSKLDSSGNSLPSSANSWSCVRDNVTGLVWEVKTNDGGIHDRDNAYRWGGVTTMGSNLGTYYDDWNILVNESNNESLCGFNDWVVPTTHELESIVDFSRHNPAIDIDYFPYTRSLTYWSSSPYVYHSINSWYVHFDLGESSAFLRTTNRRVRLVHLGQYRRF